tara:strand:+ start:463 stop:822 length:360 start_codon:yes stop_codon:yes gene_type:complete
LWRKNGGKEMEKTYLIRGNRKVELWQAGEGWNGDYNPDDPNDVELWRFDVQELVNGEWETMPDASYCTQLPVDIDFEITQKALHWIMEETFDTERVKKVCEELSWISPEWFKEPVLERF